MDGFTTALLLVVATAIGSFAASYVAFETGAWLAERQLVQAQEFEAAVQILALVHQLQRALWSRAHQTEIPLANAHERSAAAGAILDQLNAYHTIYEPWLSRGASEKLAEITTAASERHTDLALALELNVTGQPADPRAVAAVEDLRKWLREWLSPASQRLQEEFRASVAVQRRGGPISRLRARFGGRTGAASRAP